jgi:hypothetical protein
MQSSIAVLFAAVAVGAAATTSAQSSTPTPKIDTDTAVTLTGCVSGKPLASGEYTFVDGTTGSKYRLTGKSIRKFAGQQVEIVSGRDRKLVVKGGLYPSPNVAAQAGALDPALEALSRQPGGTGSGTAGTAAADLPEFRVARLRGVPGACE